jgi:ectoine hydroxylase-related dioxygenase (phytanoyl-CoA dioxygenase family)
MKPLIRFEAAEATNEALLDVLQREHAVIVEGLIEPDVCAAIQQELESFIAGTRPFEDDFVGRATTRTGGLVARSATARNVVTHPQALALARAFLSPWSTNIQLNVTQIMRILPGEKAQGLHRDRYLWSRALPPTVEPQFNCMWALTDFTEENGATRVVPGSHRWDWDRSTDEIASVAAEMRAGSVLYYSGSVVHGGGANRMDTPRVGMNITYLLGWLRQEENQYLSCPPAVARTLDPELQALLGYSIGNGSLGYFSPTTPSAGHVDTLPPEVALGRTPSTDAGRVVEQDTF